MTDKPRKISVNAFGKNGPSLIGKGFDKRFSINDPSNDDILHAIEYLSVAIWDNRHLRDRVIDQRSEINSLHKKIAILERHEQSIGFVHE